MMKGLSMSGGLGSWGPRKLAACQRFGLGVLNAEPSSRRRRATV